MSETLDLVKRDIDRIGEAKALVKERIPSSFSFLIVLPSSSR